MGVIPVRGNTGMDNICGHACSGSPAYMLNRYSRIPGTQPQEYEYRTLSGKPCTRQEHVHIQY